MSIATVVLGGFGNGTVGGTIPLVVTRGYAIGEDAAVATIFEYVVLVSDISPSVVTALANPAVTLFTDVTVAKLVGADNSSVVAALANPAQVLVSD